jgi:hypothetical protein
VDPVVLASSFSVITSGSFWGVVALCLALFEVEQAASRIAATAMSFTREKLLRFPVLREGK